MATNPQPAIDPQQVTSPAPASGVTNDDSVPPATDATNPAADPALTTPPPPPTDFQPAGRRRKEVSPISSEPVAAAAPEGSVATESPTESLSGSAADVEPAKELEPEVEKTIERLQDKKVKPHQATVISAEEQPTQAPKTVAQPVVVLPLTEKKMKRGRRQGPTTSIRWLYEWCVRQIRKFQDMLVVYRDDPDDSKS